MLSGRISVGVLCCSILLYGACSPGRGELGNSNTPFPGDTVVVDSLLLEAILSSDLPWHQLNNHPSMQNVRFHTRPSQVIETMVYRTASFVPRPSTHASVDRVAAVREGSTVIIDGVAKWWDMVSAYSPQREEDALQVCTEAYAFASERRRLVEPDVYVDSTWFDIAIPPGRNDRTRLHAPIVEEGEATGTWRVSLWIMEIGRGARYHCAVGGESGIVLAVTDSILGMGYLPGS